MDNRNSREAIIIDMDSSSVHSPQCSSSWLKNNFWFLTFFITTCPFVVLGCPFYLLVGFGQESFYFFKIKTTQPVSSTKAWLLQIFNPNMSTPASILLLIPTIVLNGCVIYVSARLVANLFIIGTYEDLDLFRIINYLIIVIPLDYVWLFGYNITNYISMLKTLTKEYKCAGIKKQFLYRILIMLTVSSLVFSIRFSNKYHNGEIISEGQLNKDLFSITSLFLNLSLDFFLLCVLPLYCAFCYSIMYQMFVNKAYIYQKISQKALMDLNVAKKLYTQAADSIILINKLFSRFLSFVMFLLLMRTFLVTQNFTDAFSMVLKGPFALIIKAVGDLSGRYDVELTPTDIRRINWDILCIVIIFGMIYFTVRQAVATNDSVRELNVWLNDFVTGGGGSDVEGVIKNLGAGALVNYTQIDNQLARNDLIHLDENFIRDFRNLKGYIHSRMQLEKPALLKLEMISIIFPGVTPRLRNYRMMF